MTADLSSISEEELLRYPINKLPLTIEGTWIEECINQLYKELEEKGFVFRPVCYLTDEWLTPENEPVIGIPFYLAHPALIKLEKKMMLEAEGATKEQCMKLLRHETGHAISYAYRLHKRKAWKAIFGSSSQEYSDTYRFRPYSKNYVRHLEGFYAQFHPDEDFVETFAVWLTPRLDWAKQYQGWKVLRKLEFVGRQMEEIRDKAPLVKTGKKHWQLKSLRVTLKNFYRKKRHLIAEDFPDFHDGNLRKIFGERDENSRVSHTAVELIKQYKKNILSDVSVWTGEKKYVINDLLRNITKRCRELRLVGKEPEAIVLVHLSTYITTLVMNYRYTGWYRGNKGKKRAS